MNENFDNFLFFLFILLILLFVAFKYCPLPSNFAPVYKLIIFSLLFALIVILSCDLLFDIDLHFREFIQLFAMVMISIIITLAGVFNGVIPNNALIQGIFVLIFFYMLSMPFLRML